MEKRIRTRFDDQVLWETMRRYGIDQDQIRLLDGFESFIYEFTKGQQTYILRIGHSLRRSVELIQGEVDWINYLAKGGATVAKAILSDQGHLVEGLEDGEGGCFLATAFIKAAGGPPGKDDWNDGLFTVYGRLIGRMHALSKEYSPTDPTWKRPEWDDPGMLDMSEWLPISESHVLRKFHRLKAHLDELPKSYNAYGLIHQDAHAGNFFVEGDESITLFDFDDCAYSWYMNDIAIVLFYAVIGEDDVPAFTRTFMTHFLKGYVSENWLEASWLREIPHFLKLREIDLYAVIHRSFDVDNIDDRWVADYMKDRKYKIENDVPYIDFDFAALESLMTN